MHYIIILPAIAISVMAIVMLLLIHILSNAAVEYDVKQSLANGVRFHVDYVTVQEGELQISEDFEYESDGICYLIINNAGEVLAGEYPTGFSEKVPVTLNRSRGVKISGEKYYVRDAWIRKNHGEFYLLRGIVKKADVYSRYQMIELFSYMSVAAIFCVIIISGILLSKRISNALKDMCRTAENIGRDMDMSQRMDENNRFHEIAVLAQANNRMLERMEQAFEQQEQFTSDVAHELRTPIAVVMAQCQYSKERMDQKEDLDEALDVIYRQSTKINTIITQLLNFSRLDQGRMQKEEIDLIEIVQSVCEDQQEKAGDRIRIKTQLSEAYGTGDINLITIVIQNLITNAIKFSPEHGEIEVETGSAEGKAFVSVRDYGCGIEQKDLEHIFQRFYKCDKSRNVEGFGLGLPLSRKIAEKHGGTIIVRSKVGEGSIFTLMLPEKENK